MKIGIFGGTFNPPHNTHVDIVTAAKNQLGLDKVIVVPCGDPPHKTCDMKGSVRLELAKLAFEGIAEISDYELNKEGKSYTVETLRHFVETYPDAELYLIIGGDSLKNFGKWYRPAEIAELCTLAVAPRGLRKTPKRTVERIEEKYGATVVTLDMKPNTVNSSEIRLRYEFGLDNSHLVPKAVNDYVLTHRLFGERREMIDKLRGYLNEDRFSHTYYVVKRGLEICKESELDDVFTACLLHDCAKCITPNDYAKYDFVPQPDMPSSVIHSFLGAEVAKRDFGVTDPQILDAIAYHTTGRPNMTRLDKIVYVADKTEDSRPYPLAHLKRGSLDKMFIKCLVEAYEVCLERHHDSVCPLSEQTIDYYCAEYEPFIKATETKEKVVEAAVEQPKVTTPKVKSAHAPILNETVKNICAVLSSKQAMDIKVVDITGASDIADYFVICSGRSAPQVKALFEHLEEQMEKQGKFAARKEGQSEGRWIAVDYGDVIVHIFHQDTRELYALDTLWNNGSNVTKYED